MPKILLINECHSDNIGDQAIAFAMKEMLEENGHSVITADFTCTPPSSEGFRRRRTIQKTIRDITPSFIKKIFFAIRAIKKINSITKEDFDIAVIGGGQLILGSCNFPIAMILWAAAIKTRKKKLHVLCVGAGEQYSFWERSLYKISLKMADTVLLRDKKSIATSAAEFDVSTGLCPDIVYHLHKERHNVKRSLTLICPTDYSVYERYRKEMCAPLYTREEYIDMWEEIIINQISSGNTVLLSATTKEDLEISRAIKSDLEKRGLHIDITTELPSFTQFLEIASQCSSVISGRMHALILAHIAGATPIPYKISKKLVSFSEEYLTKSPGEIKHAIATNLKPTLNGMQDK